MSTKRLPQDATKVIVTFFLNWIVFALFWLALPFRWFVWAGHSMPDIWHSKPVCHQRLLLAQLHPGQQLQRRSPRILCGLLDQHESSVPIGKQCSCTLDTWVSVWSLLLRTRWLEHPGNPEQTNVKTFLWYEIKNSIEFCAKVLRHFWWHSKAQHFVLFQCFKLWEFDGVRFSLHRQTVLAWNLWTSSRRAIWTASASMTRMRSGQGCLQAEQQT